MKRTLSKEAPRHIGAKITIRGWINNTRALGKLLFLIVRDRSGFIQIVVEDKATIKLIENVQVGSIVKVTGLVQESSQTELGVELVDPTVAIEVPIDVAPEIEYNKPQIPSDLEHILDHRPMALRNRELKAVFKIQAEIAHAFRAYMHDVVDATEYFGPCMIGASSEGGAEFFHVDYFDHSASLAQSSQLYKQMMVGVNERVFALMPFFRAEPSQTTRHLTEGKQLEVEIGFFDSWHEIMDIEEGLMKHIVKHLHTVCHDEIKTLGITLARAPEDVPFPRLSFKEAQDIFYQRTGIDERLEPDLSPAAERELCKYAREKYGCDFVFVTDWLLSKRPFYAAPNEHHKELSNTFDLLCNGTEITSGGQRRHTFESMVEGILLKEMDPHEFTDYLSIFKYGMPPHGGFGVGLERLTMTLLSLKNIREASLFPSDTKRIASNRIKAKLIFGGENIRSHIVSMLRKNNMEFEHLVHEPTPTSQDSCSARETSIEDGVKALILRGKSTKKNYQFNVPGHLKLDMKAVAELVGEKCEFEDPNVIKERYGLIIGGIPPFGPLLGLETYFDNFIETRNQVAFNCGLSTESIIMKGEDLIKLVNPKLATFTKV
jgi:nondiscriminating aspartyl-tRNA synthetase